MIHADAWLGLNDQHLVDVGNGHQLHADAAHAFKAMQSHAAQDGQDMQIVSSYRGFQRQLSIWNRKWTGELPLLDENDQPLDAKALTDEQKVYAILTWSALPGGSRHHWGTDLDVYDKVAVEACGGKLDLVDAEYREGGPCFALANWMDAHLAEHGFLRPFLENNGGVATELWHLSFAPTAAEFEALRNPEQLRACLAQAEMQGKSTVLAMFDELYPRYVLNEGVTA